jgi:predicted GNAT family acetyltransferase
LRALYTLDPVAAGAFAPYQLADGVFYGIEEGGRLVCVAGTHLVAPTEKIGAVGNVFTHPDHRRQGLAAACTSAVCAELLAGELTVVLNVGIENAPAMRLYRQLGFEKHCTYYETVAIVDKERIR